MNLNKIARDVAMKEGKKQNLSIAQIKEVIKLYNEELEDYSPSEILKMLGW